MTSSFDLLAIEARIGRRLTRKEFATIRRLADLALAKAAFESALATLRQAHPADVSLLWETA